MKILRIALAASVCSCLLAQGEAKAAEEKTASPDSTIIYKSVGDLKLRMLLYAPAGAKDKEPLPSVLLIHGGGWTHGSPEMYDKIAKRFAGMGLRVFAIQYRLYGPNTKSVFDCVKDARSAARYLKTHAAELGIEPGKLAVCGGSAGGHLTASTALFDSVNEEGEDLAVSCVPDALILFNPVIDTSKAGYGNAKAGESWKEISPLHNVRPGMPPAIVLHATDDKTVPYKGAADFKKAMDEAKNDCELYTYPSGGHGFYNKTPEIFGDVMGKVEDFLKKHGFIKAESGKANPQQA